MSTLKRLLVVLLACASSLVAAMPAVAAPTVAVPTLFRIFLLDGTTVSSYGEYARVGDDVIFSMPVGGTEEEPRLNLVTLAAASVDWPKTERYAVSARYTQYAATRGEEDFLALSNDVARVLNDVALATDRERALQLAEQARATLLAWPDTHYGYRLSEVREITMMIDNAIASLRDTPTRGFELALASSVEPVREPLLAAPSAREQYNEIARMARLAQRPADRMAMLAAGLAFLEEHAGSFSEDERKTLGSAIEREMHDEAQVDSRYSQLSQRLVGDAREAAKDAKVRDVESVLRRIADEDRKLGSRRPETVQALRGEVEEQLAAARRLRLLRDQWILRRSAYNRYQGRVRFQLLQLVKLQPQLDAIRRLDGPSPDRLASLTSTLTGGADRLQRLEVPAEMRAAHDLLVGAWRFAENAAASRYDAVSTGNLSTAWSASSAAAGALMLLARAQEEIRAVLAIPQLR